MKKILVVQTGFLGDVILSSPVYRNLKEIFPGSSTTVLTTPLATQLVEKDPDVDRVQAFDKRGEDSGFSGLLRMAKKLRVQKFDIVFSLHKSSRTSLLLKLAGIPLRYGFSEAALSFLYTSTFPRKDLEHDVLRNLAIFRNVGIEPKELKQEMRIGYSPEWLQEAKEVLDPISSKPLVGIAPGSVWETKKWSSEGFAKVASELQKEGFSVVLIGGPADKDSASIIMDESEDSPLDLVGKTSIGVSATIVSKLKLLITNDSAPLHMASAGNVPVVALFCATVPSFGYGPWKVPHLNLGIDSLECRPCGRHGGNSCPVGTFDCRNLITPEMVIAASKRVMEEASVSAA